MQLAAPLAARPTNALLDRTASLFLAPSKLRGRPEQLLALSRSLLTATTPLLERRAPLFVTPESLLDRPRRLFTRTSRLLDPPRTLLRRPIALLRCPRALLSALTSLFETPTALLGPPGQLLGTPAALIGPRQPSIEEPRLLRDALGASRGERSPSRGRVRPKLIARGVLSRSLRSLSRKRGDAIRSTDRVSSIPTPGRRLP